MSDLIFPGVAALLFLGLGGVLLARHVVKIVMALSLLQSSTALLFVALGYRNAGGAPLFSLASEGGRMSLPAPQAMAMAVLVVSSLFTALLLAFCLLLHRRYGTFDIDEIRRSL